jgi:hypothetical protein
MKTSERWSAISNIINVGDKYETLEIKETGRDVRISQSNKYNVQYVFQEDFHPFGFARMDEKIYGKETVLHLSRIHINRDKAQDTLYRMTENLVAQCNAPRGYVMTKVLACCIGTGNIIKDGSQILLLAGPSYQNPVDILINADEINAVVNCGDIRGERHNKPELVRKALEDAYYGR